MQLLALGLNHTTAPLSVRERVAFGPEEVADTITRLLERFVNALEDYGKVESAPKLEGKKMIVVIAPKK